MHPGKSVRAPWKVSAWRFICFYARWWWRRKDGGAYAQRRGCCWCRCCRPVVIRVLLRNHCVIGDFDEVYLLDEEDIDDFDDGSFGWSKVRNGAPHGLRYCHCHYRGDGSKRSREFLFFSLFSLPLLCLFVVVVFSLSSSSRSLSSDHVAPMALSGPRMMMMVGDLFLWSRWSPVNWWRHVGAPGRIIFCATVYAGWTAPTSCISSSVVPCLVFPRPP